MLSIYMQIRPAMINDIPSIISVRTAAFKHYAPSFYDATQVATLLSDYSLDEFRFLTENAQMFVCEDGENLLGTAGWRDENIRHVYVLPERSRKGIGKLLLAHAENDYRLRTRKASINAGVILYAKGFYEKNGYRLLSRERYWDGSEFYKMQKSF